MMCLAQGAGSTATKDIQPGFSNGILILNNPLSKVAEDPEFAEKVVNISNAAGGNLSADNSKLVYCTLQWFIHTLNEFYSPTDSARLSNVRYYLGDTARNAGIPGPELCSSDPFNILICGNDAGNYGEDSGLPEEEQLLGDTYGPAAQKGESIDCSNILIS